MEKIQIQGYKSIKDLSLGLRPINILIGANGSGKSNFLSFFEFLNVAYEKRLTEYVALNGGTERFLFNGPKVTENILAEMSFGGNTYGFELSQGDGRFVFTHEKLGYCSSQGVINNEIDIANYNNEASIKDYDGMKRGEYVKQYLSGIRKYHFHDTGKHSPFIKTSNINNDSYYLYSKGDNLAAFLYAIKENKPKTYKRILRVVQSVAPYFNDFYFSVNPNGDLRLQWTDKYSDIIYGPTDLSDGTIRFIALAALFLQPNPPSVIILDEPELGLHPFAIAKLSGIIKSAAEKGCQVIIATQSADLIKYFSAEDIITIDSINGESHFERLDSSKLQLWLDNYYSLGDLWRQNIITTAQPNF